MLSHGEGSMTAWALPRVSFKVYPVFSSHESKQPRRRVDGVGNTAVCHSLIVLLCRC